MPEPQDERFIAFTEFLATTKWLDDASVLVERELKRLHSLRDMLHESDAYGRIKREVAILDMVIEDLEAVRQDVSRSVGALNRHRYDGP